jgi:hypothetical protein
MEGLDAQSLLGLLGTYESALAELHKTADVGVEGLIARLTRHRSEVITALADMQTEDERRIYQ